MESIIKRKLALRQAVRSYRRDQCDIEHVAESVCRYVAARGNPTPPGPSLVAAWALAQWAIAHLQEARKSPPPPPPPMGETRTWIAGCPKFDDYFAGYGPGDQPAGDLPGVMHIRREFAVSGPGVKWVKLPSGIHSKEPGAVVRADYKLMRKSIRTELPPDDPVGEAKAHLISEYGNTWGAKGRDKLLRELQKDGPLRQLVLQAVEDEDG